MAATKSLGTLTIDLIAKTGGWTAGLTAAEREAEKSSRRIKGQFNQLKAEAKTLGKATAAGLVGVATGATAALAAMVRSGNDSVAQLRDMADQIGVTTNQLSSLRYAASQMASLGEGQFDTAFRRMTRRVAEFAATGQGAAANALKQLNLSSQELARLNPEQQLKLIADRMQQLPTDAQRTAMAFRIFGAEGQALGQAFKNGAQGIEDMQNRADELGITIDQINANKVVLLAESATEANAMFKAFKEQLAGEFAPVLIGIVEATNKLTEELGGMDKVAADTFNNTVDAAAFVVDAFDGIGRVVDIVGIGILGLGAKVTEMSLTAGAAIIDGPTKAANFLIEQLNKIPGIDVEPLSMPKLTESLREAAETARFVFEEAKGDIDEILMRPLPSESFRKFVADAQEAAEEAARAMGAPIQGEIESDLDTKASEQSEKKLEALRKSLRDERQVILDDFEERQRILLEARQLTDLNDEEHAEMLEQITSERNAKLTEIERKESEKRIQQAQRERQQKIDALGTTFGALSTLMNTGSRKLFEIGKVAAISNSIVSTYAGATKALELGWPLGPIAAGAITVAGMANVASIGSTSFGAKTAPATSVSAGLSAQSQPVTNTAAQAAGPSVQITFTGDVTGFDKDELADAIVGQMSDKINNYDEILISPTSRQAAALRA